MEFQVTRTTSKSARIGDIVTDDNKTFETPNFLVGTRCGSVPHLTRDTLRILDPDWIGPTTPILIPFNYHAGQVDVLQRFGKGIAEFVGLKDNLIFVYQSDPSYNSEFKPGLSDSKTISLWDYHGNRLPMTPEIYMDGINALQPHAFIALSDGETPDTASEKRIAKSASKSLRFLEMCLNALDKSDRKIAVFASLEGGYNPKTRLDFARRVLEHRHRIAGFFIDGFGNEIDNVDKIVDVIAPVIKILPENKPRILFGNFEPAAILSLVEIGVDIFESSYPYHAVSAGHALIFPTVIREKRNGTESFPAENGKNDDNDDESKSLFLDLNDEKYKNDFSPVSSSCICYACRKHTRAYIHHLLVTKELLSGVLLTMHNLHHFKVFFETVRTCLREDKFRLFKAQFVIETKS